MAQPPINPKVLAALKAVAAAKRKPIVVTNPNDPRLKAYQDSLATYERNVVDPYTLSTKKLIPLPKRIDQSWADRGIMPILWRGTTHEGTPFFKKPEQPVVLQTPPLKPAVVQRTPVVVTNPNDPRLKAYQDSARLYNQGEKRLKDFKEYGDKNNLKFVERPNENNYLPVEHKKIAPINRTGFVYNFNPENLKEQPSVVTKDNKLNKKLYPEASDFQRKLGMPHSALIPIYKKPEQPVVLQRNNGTTRPDGTQKGKGFFGEIKRPDGKISTELSISTSDIIPGKEALIPTMVPTLTHPEVQHLLSGKYNPQARQGVDDIISRKAIDFARQRAAKKQPFFATPQEEGKFRPQAVPIPALLTPKQVPIPQAPLPATPAPQPVAVAQPVQPAPPNKPDSLWAPGQRYSLKDEKVRRMLKAIQSLKRQ